MLGLFKKAKENRNQNDEKLNKLENNAKRKYKYIYFFGELGIEHKDLLGGKGAGLSEMKKIGIPVPNGFTITTEACREYFKHDTLWKDLIEEIKQAMKQLEKQTGKDFGAKQNPLLVSVRSGARISMPGMMDTILNLGLNDEIVEVLAKQTNPRFAYDSYRRFMQMFGEVVLGIKKDAFEDELAKIKEKYSCKTDKDLDEKALKELIRSYKQVYKRHKKEFPQNPEKQLFLAIEAVFKSWNNERAIKYRELNNIPHDLGTAVNIVEMVFGNQGDDSGTGVAFTRNPNTGEKEIFGEFLENAQGEDVVAGIRTPKPIKELKRLMPKVYKQLVEVFDKLEKHFKDMQDVEFTVEKGKLFILQTRNGKRTARAAIRIAVDMVKEKILSEKEALLKVEPKQIEQLLHKQVDPNAKKQVIAKGLPASPGAAVGKAIFNSEEAELLGKNEPVILIRPETSPEDIKGMAVAQGILTSIGGMTSHAAVVARAMGKCAIVGCSDLTVYDDYAVTKDGIKIKKGDWITLDGHTGEVILGQVPLVEPKLDEYFHTFMKWAKKYKKLKVLANADTPEDARKAVEFGAEGIGLARTEHMFFNENRIQFFREMIIAKDEKSRREALRKLLPLQRQDFIALFEIMKEKPVTIRLLDPPLHEFLPSLEQEEDIKRIAEEMHISEELLIDRIKELREMNPMLGHRGVRLAITYPEIYGMQVQAIFEAVIALSRQGKKVKPEIMIPLVATANELKLIKEKIDNIAINMMKDYDVKFEYKVGTMIELPRAALKADEIAQYAEFFSFGTNDLTQMTFGFSRDDVGKFLSEYKEKQILDEDPFKTLDDAVVELISIAVTRGKKTRAKLKVGVCGEQGGDPKSIRKVAELVDYVSCSPYRIPVAILASAQSAILNDQEEKLS